MPMALLFVKLFLYFNNKINKMNAFVESDAVRLSTGEVVSNCGDGTALSRISMAKLLAFRTILFQCMRKILLIIRDNGCMMHAIRLFGFILNSFDNDAQGQSSGC
jgi:hypothetical protein